MIYLDNSATTLQKPPEMAKEVAKAINTLGNPGRSFCGPSVAAARIIMGARAELARLFAVESPMNIAFTSGATESLNLVLQSLLSAADHVITSILEHNSVLRPLYNIGCEISFVESNADGSLKLENLENILKPNTRCFVCTHASNVTGVFVDPAPIYSFCKKHGIIFILDISQTAGCAEVRADMADVLCFTGHKALFGPQGTGGIVTKMREEFSLVKTGGSGSNTYAIHQPLIMPDFFEAGTANSHSIAGLKSGVGYVNCVGTGKIVQHEKKLEAKFLFGLKKLQGVKIYGRDSSAQRHLPVLAFNIGNMPSEDVAHKLWEGWQIAVRAGAHCAPLVHKHFKTEEQGMVRVSFGFLNTMDEVAKTLVALHTIAKR